MKKPKCVIVTGRPGAGKTTLAKKLGERLGMPVISRDEIKEGYVNTWGVPHDQLPPSTNGHISQLFFQLVNSYLAAHVSVVIEAAFQHNVWQAQMPDILELSVPLIIECSLNSVTAAHRHLQRGLNDPKREFFHGDTRVAHYKVTGEILPPDVYTSPQLGILTIQVGTRAEYVPDLDEIVSRINDLQA